MHIFGKASIVSRDPPSFRCQFGEDGCKGNKALLCIYNHSPSFADAIRVMECLYEVRYYTDASLRMCYEKFRLDGADARECFGGSEADQLLLEAGDQTPRLRWVPSFHDGESMRVDTRNLIQYICSRIGDNAPEVCETNYHNVGMETDLYVFLLQTLVVPVQKGIPPSFLTLLLGWRNGLVVSRLRSRSEKGLGCAHVHETGKRLHASQHLLHLKYGNLVLLPISRRRSNLLLLQ